MDAWGQLIGALASIKGTDKTSERNVPESHPKSEQDPARGFRTSIPRAIVKSVSLFIASSKRAARNNGGGGVGVEQRRGGKAGKRRRRALRRASMEEVAGGKTNPKLIEALKKKTHFTKPELEALCKIYRRMVANNKMAVKISAMAAAGGALAKPAPQIEGIDRTLFREVLHSTFDLVAEDTLTERIFCAWDRAGEGTLRLEPWLIGLSTVLRGSRAERAAFCFRVYDLNADGYIARDEMFQLLKNCLMKQPQDEDPDEGVRDLVELVLKKLDLDKDGKVSLEDFQAAVEAEPLLLEAFGQCMPTDAARDSFISTLQL